MSLPVYFIYDGPRLTRRSFLTATTSLAAAALWSGTAWGAVRRAPHFPAYPFQLGVASGDPDEDGFVIWTRLAPDPLNGGGMSAENVQVQWQVAEDEGMSRVVRRGTAVATQAWAHSVHVELHGLRPDRWYWYQFQSGGEVSPVGRSRTLPPRHSLPERLRFAFISCNHYEYGYFTTFDHLRREDIDLVVHLGDYIYEGPADRRRFRQHHSDEIFTLEDYRNRYAQYRTDPFFQLAHAAAPWIVTWDDHEVDNNYANLIPEEKSVNTLPLLERRAHAYRAYYEHMPLRRAQLPRGPDLKLFRRLSFGRLVDFHVLDTRQHRTDQPCGDVNTADCPGALDPRGTLLGARQKAWLLRGLAQSKARWNALAQQVMMARVDRTAGVERSFSMDQWPGYEMERRELLRFFGSGRAANPIVLTGDIHSHWANELLADFDRPESKPVAAEFVGTSMSSGGDGAQAPATLGQLLSENPFVKFHNTERGYVHCEVTPRSWRADYRTVEYITRPDAPLQTRASFVVEAGRPHLLRA